MQVIYVGSVEVGIPLGIASGRTYHVKLCHIKHPGLPIIIIQTISVSNICIIPWNWRQLFLYHTLNNNVSCYSLIPKWDQLISHLKIPWPICIYHGYKYSQPLFSTRLKLLAAVTTSSHFEYDAANLVHIFIDSFFYSSLENLSSSIKLGLVVPFFFHLQIMEAIVIYCDLHCCRNFSVPFSWSVPWYNPVSEIYRQFLGFIAWFVHWHPLSTMISYIDKCVPFQIMFN